MDGMKRVPEHIRENLKAAYDDLMHQHEMALMGAYSVGLKFRMKYVTAPDFDAKYVIVRTKFSCCTYDQLDWWHHGLLYSLQIYYKKLDKKGRPNGKEQEFGYRKFDVGCWVIEDEEK